jgi:hypothetical protein
MCLNHPATLVWETLDPMPEEPVPESVIDLDVPVSMYLTEVAKKVAFLEAKLKSVQSRIYQADIALAAWENIPRTLGDVTFSHWISESRCHLTKALETL